MTLFSTGRSDLYPSTDDQESGHGDNGVAITATHDESGNHGDGEKRTSPTHRAMSTLDSSSPISYMFLTFDTPLPLPPSLHDSRKLPLCPDLRPYMSPMQWGQARKNIALALSCISTFLTAYTAGCYSPPADLIAHDLGTTRLVTLVGLTTFTTGFAFAPMALAPISEIWGRFPVFIVAGFVFVIFQAVCSVMPHIAGLIIARFFLGCGASVFSAVVGGVIADIWDKKERNTPMALFSGSVLAGTGAGPLVASGIIKNLGQTTLAWKWTFWHQIILDGALLLALIFLFKESRASVLLTRKAKLLNRWYEELEGNGCYGLHAPRGAQLASVSASSSNTVLGPEQYPLTQHELSAGCRETHLRIRWVVEADEKRHSLGKMMATSVRRPFHMLLTEPVVLCFSIWAAFSWAILYLSFSVVPLLYKTDFDLASRVYVAIITAAVVATVVSILQQHLLKHPQWMCYPEPFQYSHSKFWAFMRTNFPPESPEARLYFACVTSLLLPVGLLGGFLCPQYMNGYAPAIGLGFAVWGIYSIYLATFNYLADSYHIYASSALAAQNFCRNVLGGIFPLIVNAMFVRLGVKGAGGLLGGIAALLSVIPWVLMLYGGKIRSRSKLAMVSSVFFIMKSVLLTGYSLFNNRPTHVMVTRSHQSTCLNTKTFC